MVKVYDTRPEGHGSLGTLPRLHEDDFEALQNFYKFEIDRSLGEELAGSGELYWELHGFELKAGPAILQPMVWDENGQKLVGPEYNIALLLHWPGVDKLHPDFEPRYEENAIPGFTKGAGDVGWGFGGDSHIGPDGGPFTVWVSADPPNWSDRKVGSDAVRKLGWWDDHIIPNPIFQITRKDGSVPPPIGTEYLANVDALGVTKGHIPFIPGPPSVGQPSLVLMRDGQKVGHVVWQ